MTFRAQASTADGEATANTAAVPPPKSFDGGTAPTLQPGDKCICGRTIPHPKKPSSPTSKTRGYKVPLDELDAHNEVLEAAAEHIGAKGLPFWAFKTVTAALAVLLQDEGAKGLHG